MTRFALALSLAALAFSANVAADEALVKKNACIGCHDMKAKRVGPTWKEIAAKSSEAEIAAAIVNGSKGKFGKIPMPPQPKAAADAPAIAKWIASLK